jgi:hypothetical protein
MDVFFSEDRAEYLNLLHEQATKFGLQFLSYCLMKNTFIYLPFRRRQIV